MDDEVEIKSCEHDRVYMVNAPCLYCVHEEEVKEAFIAGWRYGYCGRIPFNKPFLGNDLKLYLKTRKAKNGKTT